MDGILIGTVLHYDSVLAFPQEPALEPQGV